MPAKIISEFSEQIIWLVIMVKCSAQSCISWMWSHWSRKLVTLHKSVRDLFLLFEKSPKCTINCIHIISGISMYTCTVRTWSCARKLNVYRLYAEGHKNMLSFRQNNDRRTRRTRTYRVSPRLQGSDIYARPCGF
jgi:hypothetical protein